MPYFKFRHLGRINLMPFGQMLTFSYFSHILVVWDNINLGKFLYLGQMSHFRQILICLAK